MQPSHSPTKQVCVFFTRGTCSNGNNCRFLHLSSLPTSSSSPTAIPPKPAYKPVCNFFLKGTCTNGDACRFAHPPSSNATYNLPTPVPSSLRSNTTSPPPVPNPNLSPTIITTPTTPSTRPCSFFQKGNCTNGTACKFSHTALSPTSTQNLATEAQALQDLEPRPYATVAGPFYSIDVECVATGYGHLHRSPGRVAMVDENGGVVFDRFVKPKLTVVSYLTLLTGLKKEDCETADSLEEVVEELKKVLPKNAVLVGQGIIHDIEWLNLIEGTDFASQFDVADIFKQRRPASLAKPDVVRYRIFSLRQVCLCLLNVDMQSSDHSPIDDAAYSMKLFTAYRAVTLPHLKALRESVARAPNVDSFGKVNPIVECVVMGKDGYRIKRAGRKILGFFRKAHGLE